MLSPGQQLALNRQTIAIGLEDGKRVAMLVPDGAIVEILPGYKKGDITVEVLWAHRQVTMFAADIEERGRTVKPKAANS